MTDKKETAPEEKALVTKSVGIDTSVTTAGGLIPHNLDQLWRLALMMSKSGMMPTGIQTPEAVAVAVQMGLEVGLSPMQAVQNIAVINGRPSIWGDAVLGLVRASGLLVDFDEFFVVDGERIQPNGVDHHLTSDKLTAVCIAKRKDQDQPIERAFSIADAKLAGLWGKNVWEKYPKRMLQMRPRSWTLRDGFGDVIKGLRVAEEVIDMVSTNGQSFETGAAPVSLTEKLKPTTAKKTTEGKDPYATQEKPESEKKEEETVDNREEQGIRHGYVMLGKREFKKYVKAELENIPTYPQINQDEIYRKWQQFFPNDPYPLAEVVKETPVEEPNGTSETETELMLKLVDGAELTEDGIVVGCREREPGIKILRAKCDGIGFDRCEKRDDCLTWMPWDKRDKE